MPAAALHEAWNRLGEEFLLNPWFYAVFVVVLALELWLPARRAQSLWSPGVREDLVWVPVKLVVHVTLIAGVIVLVRTGYDRYLGFATLETVREWPAVVRGPLGLLAGDFLFWVVHYVRHKVSFLWHFHTVHHSQRDLNFFTEYRVHPLDDVFALVIGAIPTLIVEPSSVTVAAIVWARHWHTRLYHANIRTDFGWLRYVLVTPQSHRVHHSIEARHQDKNFGLTFSIWDHLFGTQHRGYDEYPETGVRGAEPTTLVAQLLYPFKQVARSALPASRQAQPLP